MATASVSVESNEMECAICHEQFTDPKLLPCGHLLCRLCLLSWLQSQVDAKCPLCHCIIMEPGEQAGKSVEDVVDGFPTDYVMAALVESQQLLNKDHVCKACVSQAATSLCLNCGDLLCSSCLTIHSRMAATRNHTAENLSSLTAEKLAANRRYIGTNQADDTFKLFCPTHGVAICHICATSQHGGHCPEVKDLEKKVKEARAVLAELASMLNAGEAELDKAIRQLDQHLQETEKRTRTAIVEVETTCDRLESAIKACRRRLKELVLGARAEVDEAVQAGKTCLLQRRGKLTSHKRVIQRVQEVTFRDDPMDMTSVMKARVDNLDCSVTLPADAKVVTMATLVIDPETVSSLEGRLLKLGQVMIVPADVSAQVLAFCQLSLSLSLCLQHSPCSTPVSFPLSVVFCRSLYSSLSIPHPLFIIQESRARARAHTHTHTHTHTHARAHTHTHL